MQGNLVSWFNESTMVLIIGGLNRTKEFGGISSAYGICVRLECEGLERVNEGEEHTCSLQKSLAPTAELQLGIKSS